MQRGGQCSPGLDEEDEGTAGGCSLEGNRWRAGAGAPTSRHDLTWCWCSSVWRAGAGAGEWSVATECLMGHCWAGNLRFSGPHVHLVTKLTGPKINFINQNRKNAKNNLVAVNMNNASTTQIKINSCKTTQARQPNKRSDHWITIAGIKRKIYGFTYSGCCANGVLKPSVKMLQKERSERTCELWASQKCAPLVYGTSPIYRGTQQLLRFDLPKSQEPPPGISLRATDRSPRTVVRFPLLRVDVTV
jgi:hypothetical protein